MKNKIFLKIQLFLLMVFLGAGFFAIDSFAEMSASDVLKDVDIKFCNGGNLSSSLELDISAGNKQEICYEITNKNKTEYADISLNFVDGIMREDGSNRTACLDEKDKKEGLSSVITNEQTQIYLKPEETQKKFAIIEATDKFNGDTYACISIKKTGQEIKDGMVSVVLRSVFKIKATYAGGNIVDTKNEIDYKIPEGMKLIKKEGSAYILIDKDGNIFVDIPFKNNGTRDLSIFAKLNVKGDFDYVFYREDNINILSGETKNFRFSLPKLPLTKGKLDFNIEIVKTPIEKLGQHGSAPVNELITTSIVLRPIGLIMGILGLLTIIILILIIFISKRNRKNKAKREYIVQKGDTLESISKEFGCTWNDIADLNNISAPYFINEGEKIIVLNYKEK